MNLETLKPWALWTIRVLLLVAAPPFVYMVVGHNWTYLKIAFGIDFVAVAGMVVIGHIGKQS